MRTHRIWLFICLLLITYTIMSGGCVVWRKSQKCIDNTINSLFSFQNVHNGLCLKLLWNRTISRDRFNDYFYKYPVWDGGDHIFIADCYGVVKKLNVYTGNNVWTTNLSPDFNKQLFNSSRISFVSGGMVVNKNYLYLGSELGTVYALNINTGGLLWVTSVLGEVVSSPAVGHGLVFVYTGNGKLQALNEKSGVIQWTADLLSVPYFSFCVKSVPVVASDFVIFGDSSGVVSACSIDSGELIWQKKIVENVFDSKNTDRLFDIIATPIVSDNIVYVIACNESLLALDLLSGELIWSKNISSLHNIIVEDGLIYLVDQDLHLVALNASDGSVVWRQNFLLYSRELMSPVIYKDYLLIGDIEGDLYWLNKKHGYFLGKKNMGVGFFIKPVIIYDMVVVYGSYGKVSAWTCVSSSN